MKIRIGSVVAVLALTMFIFSTTSFASGGKNHGDKGKGTVSTGTTAKGAGSQPRTGR